MGLITMCANRDDAKIVGQLLQHVVKVVDNAIHFFVSRNAKCAVSDARNIVEM